MSEDVDIDQNIDINLTQDDFANSSITAMWHEDDLEFYFHGLNAPTLIMKKPKYSWDLNYQNLGGCVRPSCWGKPFSGSIEFLELAKFPKIAEKIMCILEENCDNVILKTKTEEIIMRIKKNPGITKCPNHSNAQDKLACKIYYLIGELKQN